MPLPVCRSEILKTERLVPLKSNLSRTCLFQEQLFRPVPERSRTAASPPRASPWVAGGFTAKHRESLHFVLRASYRGHIDIRPGEFELESDCHRSEPHDVEIYHGKLQMLELMPPCCL